MTISAAKNSKMALTGDARPQFFESLRFAQGAGYSDQSPSRAARAATEWLKRCVAAARAAWVSTWLREGAGVYKNEIVDVTCVT